MKNLVACGCSFMTSSFHKYQSIKGKDWPDYEKFSQTKLSDKLKNEISDWNYEHNLHFVDLYAIIKNLNYTNLAYSGASNFAIRMQMIRNFSDIAEINLSSYDNKIIADHKRSVEFSTNLEFIKQNIDVQNAIKYYLSYLYDNDIDNFKNYYIIQDGLRLLETLQIPYIFIPGPLRHLDWSEFKCWPEEYSQPWDLCDSPVGNHLSEYVHQILFQTLNEITKEWDDISN